MQTTCCCLFVFWYMFAPLSFFGATLSLHPHPHFAADCLMFFPVTDKGEEQEEEGIRLTSVLRLLASFICGMWNFLSLSPHAFLQGFPVSAGGVCGSKVRPTVIPSTCQVTVATPFLSSPLRLSRMVPQGTTRVEVFFWGGKKEEKKTLQCIQVHNLVWRAHFMKATE